MGLWNMCRLQATWTKNGNWYIQGFVRQSGSGQYGDKIKVKILPNIDVVT